MQSYQELIVWQKSFQLCKEIYRVTSLFPQEERYGLQSQMRRAAVSIPSNIAEGYSRKGSKEFGQFLAIALGSSSELETQMLLARDIGYIASDRLVLASALIEEVRKMLVSLRRKV